MLACWAWLHCLCSKTLLQCWRNAALKQRLYAQEQRHASELDQLKAHHKQQG
jgi:hypothetical protein